MLSELQKAGKSIAKYRLLEYKRIDTSNVR